MRRWLLVTTLGAVCMSCAVASVRDNSYGVIVERNPFGLRPPPVAPPPAPEVTPPPARPELRITGITTLLGAARVMLQYEDKEAKKVEFPPLLTEGEKYRELVVEKIDVEKQIVTVRNGEILEILDFVNDGVKPKAPAPGAATPAMTAPPAFTASAPPSFNNGVIVTGPSAAPTGPPGSRPPMTPDQARAYMEELRRKQPSGGLPSITPPATLLPPGARGSR